ncbi:uncharacterized protein A4U43_C08F24210 [Asparagus officinalis]|nr:uncharacterized protein A4U43_C08F24210 [Asparagus officinalis]
MAMVKLLVLLAIALFVIMMAESSLATPPVTAGGEYHLDRAGSGYGPGSLKSYQLNLTDDLINVFGAQNAKVSATGGAQGRNTRSPASSSATSAAQSASVFLLVSTATRESAPATTTGRPRKEDQNAPKIIIIIIIITIILSHLAISFLDQFV